MCQLARAPDFLKHGEFCSLKSTQSEGKGKINEFTSLALSHCMMCNLHYCYVAAQAEEKLEEER